VSQWCLAVVYHTLGRLPEAEGERKKYEDVMGESGAYQFATIYAQWGNRPKALSWLETALRLRNSGVEVSAVSRNLQPGEFSTPTFARQIP
jgi:hypothetical protein